MTVFKGNSNHRPSWGREEDHKIERKKTYLAIICKLITIKK
jgi:hypothetical protein